jgi:transglutaminase-like putative cysteine protease
VPRNKLTAISCFFLVGVLSLSASASVPEWLRSAAQQPVKKYADDVNAVTLLNETETTVKDTGETVTRVRKVIKVLRPDGREKAFVGVPFDDETRLNYFKGWSISARGQEYEAKKDDVAELGAGEGYEVYSDEKAKVMRIPGVDVGTIVGVEYEQKRHPYTFEDQWFFQREDPLEHGRYILHLPPGWEFRAAWLHHPEQAPVTQGNTYVWEVNDVPRIDTEDEMPHWRALAGQLIVTFFSDKVKGRTYANWSDFAAWYSQLTATVRDSSPAMQQKVQELAPATLPLLERIKALGRFAQRDVRYAAIEIGIGGYRPHQASQIFSNRYGDCKDKATVLSAMLAQIGVKSYYIPIHTDRGIYSDKTPPTNGFNHVILAIQLPQGSFKDPMPAMYEHPKLGNLLIFDPTNPFVPFGQIPSYEQDNYGLLVGDQGGELIHLPVAPPELNRINRTAQIKLLPDGSIKGEVKEVRTGSQAAEGREQYANQTMADRKKALERFLGAMLGNFQLDSVEAENLDDIDKDLIIHYNFTADHYAKNAGPLLLVRPRVLGEKLGALDGTKPRLYPYDFGAPTLQTDVFEFNLPDGYKVDELPEATKADFAFGDYESKIEDSGSTLKYSRQYEIKATSIPASRIGELKSFFHQINQDERNMAVLKKAN